MNLERDKTSITISFRRWCCGVKLQRFIGVGVQVDVTGGFGVHVVIPFADIYLLYLGESEKN